ncbi:MAG: ribonuclease catalytic domain-containing protein [Desulfobacterales bacterium]
METGYIVEFIDKQKILCAVVLEVKQGRLRLLTEGNREVSLNAGRLSHKSLDRLDMALGRARVVEQLKEKSQLRRSLSEAIDIQPIWEVLNTEQEWIDLPTMTSFCFPNSPGPDHEAAVVRAFFANRLYFKFGGDGFFPHTEAQMEQMAARQREEARRLRIIEKGGAFFKQVAAGLPEPLKDPLTPEQMEYAAILRSYYLFEKESPDWATARAMAASAGLDTPYRIFNVLVAAGVFSRDENIELLRFDIPQSFPEPVRAAADRLAAVPIHLPGTDDRVDLTHLRTMTIDGQATLDYDDAISIERTPDGHRLGIHIVDVAQFVEKNGAIDRDARGRASSIYMPDRKISMLPTALAEGLCSLKAGELRPAISTLIQFGRNNEIVSWEIVPSHIRVLHQYTYYDVNLAADEDPDIQAVRCIAAQFRKRRLENGAIQISVPEVGVWISENGDIGLSRVNRESPSRMLVSELMIMANWLMARFLAERGIPAIFRSQPPPRERLFNGDEGTLFQNWMQRRLLSRFVLTTAAEHHSGLGLEAYTTATSPIRKYGDLITQRQVRSAFGLEPAYTQEEMQKLIQGLEQPMAAVSRIQASRNRYWLLRYLESKVGGRENAIVLLRRRQNYQLLLTDYMIEVDLAASSGIQLNPEDVVQVTVQNVDARKDVITVFLS